jgi:hypothetical protein
MAAMESFACHLKAISDAYAHDHFLNEIIGIFH